MELKLVVVFVAIIGVVTVAGVIVRAVVHFRKSEDRYREIRARNRDPDVDLHLKR